MSDPGAQSTTRVGTPVDHQLEGSSASLDRRYRRWRTQIFSVTWLAYAGFYLTRKGFSVAKNELKKPEVMGLTNGDLSWMDGLNSVSYAVGQFVWGMSGDKFGPRLIVLAGMLASVIVSLATGFTNTALMIGLLFGLQGLCQASGWAPLSKNVGEFFSQRERGTIMGFWCTNYALGGFVASTVAAWAAQQFGWRYAFFIPAGGLFVIWLLFVVLQRNRPEDLGLPAIEQYHGERQSVIVAGEIPAQDLVEARRVVREVWRNKMVWLLAAVYFLVKPTRYLMLYWSPVYINDLLGTGTASSGFLSSMFDLAGPVGTLVGGLVSDKFWQSKRMPICVLSLFCLAIFMMGLHYLPPTKVAVGIGMFIIGFLIFIPDSLVAGTAAIDFGTKQGASTASGIINGCGSLGQVIGVTLPGVAEKLLGKGHDIWNPIFMGLGFSLVVAGLLLAPQWNRLPPTAQPKN